MNADATPIAADQGKGDTQIAADKAQMAADENHELRVRAEPKALDKLTFRSLGLYLRPSALYLRQSASRLFKRILYRRQSAWHRRSSAIQRCLPGATKPA